MVSKLPLSAIKYQNLNLYKPDILVGWLLKTEGNNNNAKKKNEIKKKIAYEIQDYLVICVEERFLCSVF